MMILILLLFTPLLSEDRFQKLDNEKFFSAVKNYSENDPALWEAKGIHKQSQVIKGSIANSFLGVGGIEWDRNWINSLTLNETKVYYQIPIINLSIMSRLLASIDFSRYADLSLQSKNESLSLSLGEDILKLLLAHEKTLIYEKYLKINSSRFSTQKTLLEAGLSRSLDVSQSEALYQGSQSQYESAKSDEEKQLLALNDKLKTPITLTGLPSLQTLTPQCQGFNPSAVNMLSALLDSQKHQKNALLLSYAPSLSGTFVYDKKDFVKGQKIYGLKASWQLLDGGVALQQEASIVSSLFQIKGNKETLERDLRSQYKSFSSRYESLQKALNASSEALKVSQKAQDQVTKTFNAGLIKFSDARDADEMVLKASLNYLDMYFGLQGMVLECFTLSGQWMNLLSQNNGNVSLIEPLKQRKANQLILSKMP